MKGGYGGNNGSTCPTGNALNTLGVNFAQGGGCPINILSSVEDIVNSVSIACLRNVIETISTRNNYTGQNGSLNSVVTNMLQNTFGVSDIVNLTFNDGTLTGRDSIADAIRSGGKSISVGNPDTYNLFITFNTPQIANASKEFLAETTMHEVFHAYLTVNTAMLQNMSQHDYMIQNFVNLEVAALQQNFPPLSTHDALCLVLAGYGDIQSSDPTAYGAALAMYKLTENDVSTTNNKYKSGQSGTVCN